MADEWSVEFYREANGSRPVEDFIRDLRRNRKLQAKVLRTIALFEEFGTSLPGPHSASIVGHDFRELRIQFGSDIARIFYIAASGQRMVLLHGFMKKTQKTPIAELALAQKRLNTLREQKEI